MALKDLLEKGVLKDILDIEMASWTGPFCYINQHGVPEPGSVTSSPSMVSRSSLDDDGSDDALPRGPHSLCALQQSLARWRMQQQKVVSAFAKTYNIVLTNLEELHRQCLMWRWGESEDKWLTFGLTKTDIGDRPVAYNTSL